MKQPCQKGCQNRSPTCHGTCKAYLEFYNSNRLEDKKRLQYQQADNVLHDYLLRQAIANNKNRKVAEM